MGCYVKYAYNIPMLVRKINFTFGLSSGTV
uniref:Uncharacterized protein n=1 Tax=Anguilla anguilla TaxID=7936 RepID=A0A0E9THN0_ANGAN